MTPEEILIKAAEDQVRHGHSKETFFEATKYEDVMAGSSACAYGSMARVAGGVMATAAAVFTDIDGAGISEAARLLSDQIKRDFPAFRAANPGPYSTITTFNDAESTTGEDVALMMKKAAHHG